MSHAQGKLKSHWNDQADETATEVFARPGLLAYVEVSNPNSNDCWLWLYDAEVENVLTTGSAATAPYAVLMVPSGATVEEVTLNGNVATDFNNPLELDNGLVYALSDNPDTVAAPDNECLVQIFYR